jgi:hypothetical protein
MRNGMEQPPPCTSAVPGPGDATRRATGGAGADAILPGGLGILAPELPVVAGPKTHPFG